MPEVNKFWLVKDLYDKCCDSRPRVEEEHTSREQPNGFVSVYCDSCGDALEFQLPSEVVFVWNNRKRTKEGTRPT